MQKNQHLFTVVDPSRLLARTFLPEKFSSQVTIGQDAYVETEALQAERFAARVKLISPVIDAESGTFKVTVALLNPPPTLKPGMFATVLITVATRDQALVIPKRALTLDSSRPTVYRLEKGRARRVSLKVGLSDHDRIEVVSGLEEGDRIIVVGQEKLLQSVQVPEPGAVTLRRNVVGLLPRVGAEGVLHHAVPVRVVPEHAAAPPRRHALARRRCRPDLRRASREGHQYPGDLHI